MIGPERESQPLPVILRPTFQDIFRPIFRKNKAVAKKYLVISVAIVVLLLAGYFFAGRGSRPQADFISYEPDLQKQDLRLYWRDGKGGRFQTIGRLQRWLAAKGETLDFAMNAGMFKADFSPQGLFIQEGKTITPLDTTTGEGNFYLKPNGVFFVTSDQKMVVCATEQFYPSQAVRYATQSGPMLLIDGKIHPAFQPGSRNVNIRNGVGILANGKAVFAMSKTAINFYAFDDYFRSLGCRNALYLDGFVSQTYLPEQGWIQTEGALGVIIGVTAKP